MSNRRRLKEYLISVAGSKYSFSGILFQVLLQARFAFDVAGP